MALQGLRDVATQKGLKVDWNQEQGVSINGTPVNTGGLVNYGDAPPEGLQGNTFYGNEDQINQILSPHLGMAPPAQPPQATGGFGLVGLREAATQKGLNVTWDPKLGAMINGTPVNTSGLSMQNDSYMGTQDQINQILSPYVAPQIGENAQVQGALSDYQQWASQPYVSQWAPEIEAKVKEILSRTFDYDPANDQQFQVASQELTRNVMETMASRGILNSSMTENQVQQGVSRLLPQYQQIARQEFQDEGKLLMSQVDMLLGVDETGYNRYQDEGQNYAKALDIVMQMDDIQYQRWQDSYKQRYTTARDQIQDQLDQAKEKRADVSQAWNKVSEIGYVDNASSILLGVPAGTLSKDVREAQQRKADEFEAIAMKHQQQLEQIEAQFQKEAAIAAIKGQYSGGSSGSGSGSGTPPKPVQQQDYEKKFYPVSGEYLRAATIKSLEFMTDPNEIGRAVLTDMNQSKDMDDGTRDAALKEWGVLWNERAKMFYKLQTQSRK